MRRTHLIIWIIVLFMILAGCGQSQEASQGKPQTGLAASTDSVGTALESEPKEARIIATTVAATEMMSALELELIGIPSSSKTLPDRYNGVIKVGNPMSPDMELVKSLQPTEVLSVTTLEYDLKPAFESAGLKARFLNLTSLSNMEQELLSLGEKYDRTSEAKSIVAAWGDQLADIKKRTKGREAPTVLILLGVPGSYLVATENSYIGDLVKLAGGINIVEGEEVEYLASNTEYLQQGNPDVILRAAHGMPEEVVEMFDREFKQNDIWKHFNAVKNERVYDLEERLFGTTGNMDIMEAMDALVGMLYP